MSPPTEAEFIRLSREQRLSSVKVHGEYLGSRSHGGHRIHLYRMGPSGAQGYFAEVWMRLGWNQVEWIEVARNADVLSEYIDLDLNGL